MKRVTFYLFLFVVLGSLMALPGCGGGEDAAVEQAPPEDTGPPPARPGDSVEVSGGEFTLGSDERPAGQEKVAQFYEPAHTVEVKPFKIGVFEVTNGEFAEFQIESDYSAEGNWRQFYSIGKEDNPVANVTWEDAKAFCEWRGGRLPTEAEWEMAARGPEGFTYPWGNDWDPTKSNCNELGYNNVVEVGSVSSDISPLGAHDMMGNVVEWTSDEFKPYPESPKARAPEFSRGYIAVRGASYAIKGKSFTLWTRGAYLPKAQYGIGFRCAWDMEGAGEGASEGSN